MRIKPPLNIFVGDGNEGWEEEDGEENSHLLPAGLTSSLLLWLFWVLGGPAKNLPKLL